MPTLRSRSVIIDTSPSFAIASLVSAAPTKIPLPPAGPPSTPFNFTASCLDPVTPAGDREHSLPPFSPRSLQKGGARRRKGVDNKLQFTKQNHGVAESVVRRSQRVRGGSAGKAVRCTEADAVGAETTDNMTALDKGKRKVVVVDSEEEEDNNEAIGVDISDAEEGIESNGLSLQDAVIGTSHGLTRNGEERGNGKRVRSGRGSIRPRTVNVESHIVATREDALNVAPVVQAKVPGPSRSSGRGPPIANVGEATKAKFLEIARRRAAHFAHFAGEDEPAVPAVDAAAGRCVDEQSSRASELLARVSAGVGRLDNGEHGEWPGPFIIARQLVEGRAAAEVARQESTRVAGEQPKPSVEWTPASQPYFAKKRLAISLHDMCVEVLCANIGHVQSLVGVPDATKKCVASRLCAQRKMTPAALRLYFESEPAEIVIPDCTSVTEENLTEAVACCPSQQLEVLELGMCGRCLSDQLCSTSLAGFTSPLSMLNTLVLTGAYQLTDNGLKSLLHVAPNLITLKLNQCNMISAAGLQAVAGSIGPKLKALSLDSCSQLDALQVLPSLLKMSSLQSLFLPGISGMSDGILSELAVVLGPYLRELSIAECTDLTDVAIRAVSLCCTDLRLLDLDRIPLLTDVAIGSLADGCRSLKTLRLNRGKFSDTAVAALVTASGNCLCELSLNNVRQAGDCTLSALSRHSKGTLEQLDLSFCRAVSDQALGLLADSCCSLREIRLFGCTQVPQVPPYPSVVSGDQLSRHTESFKV